MATLLELHALMQPSGKLFARVQAALVKASWDVKNELASTDNHASRLLLANEVLDSPKAIAIRAYRLALANTTIQTRGIDSTDNDIIFVVNGLINTLANSK